MVADNNREAFLTLVRAGLWEKEAQLSHLGEVDYEEIMRLAEEQSVVGLVTAGLEHVQDVKVPQEWVLQFIGSSLQIEQRSKEMNCFIAKMVEEMRKKDIYTLLMKGQGLAQCYEKPLWRSAGDIDFFFSNDGYNKAVEFFLAQENAKQVQDAKYTKSFGVVIEPWFIELHGTMRNGMSTRMDKEIDAVQRDLFDGGKVRSWKNGNTVVYLPGATNDVFLVFVHFVRHFYKEGVNLRQLCDWCRLIWTYRSELDVRALEERIKRSGLMGEWKAFATVVMEYLGMDAAAMPLYNEYDGSWTSQAAESSATGSPQVNEKLKKKAERILRAILAGSAGSKVKDTLQIAKIFPWNTIMFSPSIFFHLNWLKVKERVFQR